ncbi:MAG: alpha/beta fold hydrolase [Fusobacteriaceae bacterium]
MICGSINSPKGIVQIIHGMSEHHERYLEFAKFLNNNGYIVLLSDHKSHGKLAYENNQLGLFYDSFGILVEEQIKISKNIKAIYPKLPLFILGHSMGSFIAQEHMKYFSLSVAGYIIMGSCGENKFITNLGKKLFKIIKKFTDKPQNIFNDIFFIGCNSKIKDKNKFSWLSRDKNIVEKYIEDPLSGFSYNPNFYYEFLSFLSKLYIKSSFYNTNKTIGIFILSGEDDPIGMYGEGVKKLYFFYKNLGFSNLRLKLYGEFRHEILNELGKEEVYFDILEWLNKNI